MVNADISSSTNRDRAANNHNTVILPFCRVAVIVDKYIKNSE